MEMVYCRGCGKQIHRTARSCPGCGAVQVLDVESTGDLRTQTAAGLWCAFLGGFGAHWFYLRKTVAGVLSLLFFWTGIPGLVAFVNGIQIAYGAPRDWATKYNNGISTPPTHWAVKVAVVVFPALSILFWIVAIASS
jgi:TM2 domain-containing membrane protein YozV